MKLSELITRWHGFEKGSQTAFAQKVGVGQATVSRWCSGDSPIDERLRPKVADLLGISIEELMKSLPVKKYKEFVHKTVKDLDSVWDRIDELEDRIDDLEKEISRLKSGNR